MKLVTTETEFLPLLVQDGEDASQAEINLSTITLKQEQIILAERSNTVFEGGKPSTWDSLVIYETGDLTEYANKYYIALDTHSDMRPDQNPLHWDNVSLDIEADQVKYTRYIVQDNDPGTPDLTLWDLPQDPNAILHTFAPSDTFYAIEGLDRLKANKNGSTQEVFYVSDDTSDLSVAVSRQWLISQLSTYARTSGDNAIRFNSAEPTDLSNVTTKNYVDNIANDLTLQLGNFASVNGNTSNVFNVATPSENNHAATKSYVDAGVSNALSQGNNNLIKKIEATISSGTENSIDIGVTMVSGEVMVYSGSVLMYEGTDFSVSGSVINWFEPRVINERITVLYVDNLGMTTTLDSVYAQLTGASFSGAIKTTASPITDDELTRKDYVDLQLTTSKNYTDTKIAELELDVTPPGGIIMFHGTSTEIANLNPHWFLCDGTNGTPDLRGKFVISTGTNGADTYVAGQEGGSTGTLLTIDNLPAHGHEMLSQTQIGGSATDGGYNVLTDVAVAEGAGDLTLIAPTGQQTEVATVPPYYSLAYIMKAK